MVEDVTRTPFSGLLKEIAGVIGREATLKLAAACGGTLIYVPAKLADEHWLVEAIGRPAAEKLCKYYTFDRRGSRLNIPLGPRPVSDDHAKMSSRNAALKLGITQRTVHRRRQRQRGTTD